MPPTTGYQIVKLVNGVHSVHSLAEGETFHPVIGPVAEAEALYVKQLHLPERLAAHTGEFVIWDVGLGAAANVLTVLRGTRATACPLRVISFDHTLEPLQFALANAAALGYFTDYEVTVENFIREHHATFTDGNRQITWQLHLGDFPSIIRDQHSPIPNSASCPSGRTTPHSALEPPHAILFDAFSPAKKPRHVDPATICEPVPPPRPRPPLCLTHLHA